MARKIFVNIPVKDLDKSMAFFKAIGFSFNAQFTGPGGACMIISEDIFAMLLPHERFKGFAKREIADTAKTSEAIIALGVESKEEVNMIVDKAIQAGGAAQRPTEDHGFMYLRSFQDLDGHIWEIAWMDPAAVR
jgi:predicted lactoylglutathione lyase